MTVSEKVKSKVPQLRFPEFSGEWEKSRLGNVATFLKGKGISKADTDPEGKLECIRYGELYTHYDELIEEIRSKTNLDKKALVMSKKGDVIIPASGESALDIATASCVKKEGVAYSGDLNIIRSSINGLFLAYYLNNKRKHDIARYAQGASVIHLYATQMKSLLLWNPNNTKENDKIALFLTTVDKKISLLKQKHEQLEQYKKGIMQQLFSQQLRFKDDNGQDFQDWDAKALSSIAKKVSTKNKNDSVKSVLTNSAKHGIVNQLDYFDKDIANENNLTNYCVVEKNDFVYNPRISMHAPVGPIKRNHICKGVMSPLYTVFRFKDVELLDFVEIFFGTTFWHRYMNSIANFGARHDRMNITSGDFFALPIEVPCVEERKKLVDFVKSIDQKINLAQQQIEQTQAYKQGLLQQMFV